MKRVVATGAFALAMVLGLNAAHAGNGSGGGPIQTDPCDIDPNSFECTGVDPDPGAGGNDPGTGTGTGGTTPLPSAPTPVTYTYGSGALLFTLDSLPTGPSGTQAFYQPYQDYTNFPYPGAGTPPIASNQGGLFQTVSGTTVSFRTADYVYDPNNVTAPQTVIRVQNDSQNFGNPPPACCLTPQGVQVGIEANVGSGGAPGSVYVNFTDALSYFSINLYRLSGAFDVTSTVTAYSGLNGTGSVLGQVTGMVTGGNNFAFTTIQLANLAGARSFTLNGGSGLANYDDITATLGGGTSAPTGAVPEPATWGMFIGGFAFVGGALRRQRKAAVRFA